VSHSCGRRPACDTLRKYRWASATRAFAIVRRTGVRLGRVLNDVTKKALDRMTHATRVSRRYVRQINQLRNWRSALRQLGFPGDIRRDGLRPLVPRAAQVTRHPTNGGFAKPCHKSSCAPAISPKPSKIGCPAQPGVRMTICNQCIIYASLYNTQAFRAWQTAGGAPTPPAIPDVGRDRRPWLAVVPNGQA